ncbi:hypothetical protein K449DRAFT_440526 [Hypoxylon sp. EC38]|nr:hypothetical protein K449DRAFT_440526 [Hypoxylon sp. EC38]
MCPTCSVITQTNHSCGHQVRRYSCKAKFCLFFKHRVEDFHMVTFVYKGESQYVCEYCEIKSDANEMGLRGAEKWNFINSEYDKSSESWAIEKANRAIAAAEKSQKNVDAAKIAELNKKARTEVKWYLRNRCSKSDKVLLLKTILQVPDCIDQKALVEYFGSYAVYDQKEKIWKGLPLTDRNTLLNIARRAGLMKTLENGGRYEAVAISKATDSCHRNPTKLREDAQNTF